MENKSLLGWVIGAFLLGGILSKSIPITNTNSNGNNISISQEIPGNIEKISKNSENIEKNSINFKKVEKISKKININKATLQEFKEAKVSVGDSKYKKIVKLRPFKSVDELKTKGVLGHYAYNKHKHKFTVGD